VAVVTSNTPALREVTGGAASTADPDDPQAIAAAMERLLSDDARRRALAAQGLEVAAKHRWDTSAKAFLGACRRFFAGNPST
jgi:glycosyltransferase involved in cell wall biosynthesis